MHKVAHKNIYEGFKSFSEIINWLREDWKNRSVKYDGDKEIGVFLSWNTETQEHDLLGKNVDTFEMLDRWFDDEPEISSLEDYFDENDQPLDEEFAKDYDLSKFTGEEYVKEK